MRAFGQPWQIGKVPIRVLQVGIAHKWKTAKRFREQRDASTILRHGPLTDFLESISAVKQQRYVVAGFEEDFAGKQRNTRFRVAGRVGVEHATKAETAVRFDDDDAVDVNEFGVAFPKPEEIGAAVIGVLAHRRQETGNMAVDLGHAEVAGLLI